MRSYHPENSRTRSEHGRQAELGLFVARSLGHPGDGRKRVHWETTGHQIDP